MHYYLIYLILVLTDCETVASLQNHGYGRNFKYRKKVYDVPTISVEYPAFKQFDGEFCRLTLTMP